MDYRNRVKLAIEKYNKKEEKKNAPRQKKKNNKPEKFVVANILEWGKVNGFDLDVVEAKAVFNIKAGRYLKGQAPGGFPDIVGNAAKDGTACYIEAKAPGRLSTLREQQRDFLTRKILTNCFAVCVDSHETLQMHYENWLRCKRVSPEHARTFLMTILPQKPGISESLDFTEDEVPF